MSRVAPLAAPRHLVVRLPNPLGDAVMATPALRALRTALPAARITWAGNGAVQQALEGLAWRDDVVPLAGRMLRGWRSPWRAARHLRRLGADAVLLLPNSFSSALGAWLARIPVRVGTPLHRRGRLLTDRVDLPLAPDGRLAARSMRLHYLALAARFGAEDDGQGTALAVRAHDRERAARRLASAPPGAVLVGVNAGASFGPSKVWPPRLLGQALRRLRASTGALPLVLCAPGEEALARAVVEAAGTPVLGTHEAPPDLGELKALLQHCRVLLTTDAGPRHVAEALGVPTVVWVGPTDPRWGEGGAARVVRVEGLPCLACHERRCPLEGHPCMERLEPATVVEAAERLLEAPAGGRPPAPPAPR